MADSKISATHAIDYNFVSYLQTDTQESVIIFLLFNYLGIAIVQN